MGSIKVILQEKVNGLGEKLTIREVKKGYAFNFLIPEGLAKLVTPKALVEVENEKKRLEELEEAMMKDAESIVEKINGKEVEFVEKASDKGVLYGSIKELDIVNKLSSEYNVKILEKSVKMSKHLKDVGEEKVTIEISKNYKAEIIVVVKNSN